MPAKVTKNKDGSYKVSTPNAVHAKGTTKGKAEAQARLLNAMDHGFVPDKQKHSETESGKKGESKSRK
ncbi:hypothetical protein LPW11_20350 [Geomonas sp. RF6]|uniref:hypothetical protein n=1 Tax=Geomonas sp. RF6 TaxID=2897342 RepID=UPI001E5D375F|nr:hypothetical protein [Geomonas sp. RF6]UFS70212.1 hypothetical protein LPW11_20350 [Geomonas sp. RF6]